MDPIEVVGVGSAFMLIYALLANEYGSLSMRSPAYDWLNLLGAIGLFFYAFATGVVPFLFLNLIWAGVAGIDVWRHTKKYRKQYLSIRKMRRMLR